MPRGTRAVAPKQSLFSEICTQLNIQAQGSWMSSGSTVTAPGFQAVLEQVAKNSGVPPTYLRDYEVLVWRLIHKSVEAMVLALEIVNKPSIGYRLESFLFLFINAWELSSESRDRPHQERCFFHIAVF